MADVLSVTGAVVVVVVVVVSVIEALFSVMKPDEVLAGPGFSVRAEIIVVDSLIASVTVMIINIKIVWLISEETVHCRLSSPVALADLGGAPDPKWDPILSFLYTFSPNSACVGGQSPQWDCPPPAQSWIRP